MLLDNIKIGILEKINFKAYIICKNKEFQICPKQYSIFEFFAVARSAAIEHSSFV